MTKSADSLLLSRAGVHGMRNLSVSAALTLAGVIHAAMAAAPQFKTAGRP
jgi:hypothetical protein